MAFKNSALGKIAAKRLGFRQYQATSIAVRKGEELANYDKETLDKKGLLSPWVFNIQETIYATVPSIIIIALLNQFYSKPEISVIPASDITDKQKMFLETFQMLMSFFDKLQIPIIITLFGFLIVWGITKKANSTLEIREKTLNAYLYYNGAYGLLPQTLIVLCLSLFQWAELRPQWLESLPESLPFIVYFLLAVSSIALMRLIAIKIPKRLFEQLGYSTKIKGFWHKSLPDDPPWSKYILVVFIGGVPLVMSWLIFIYGISHYISTIVTELAFLAL